MKKIITITLIVSMVSMFSPLHQVKAQDFDPSFIINNSDLQDFESMNLGEIQSFLESFNSFLATYVTEDAYGTRRSAAEIIYNAARTHYINPKWILTTLQKEQSLVADQQTPTPNRIDWAMGYGVCDDCSKDDPLIQKFKGFGKQVDRAAARVRFYITNPHLFNFKAGGTYEISGETVTIKNLATATLYIYTPHIHGNQNFWKIWSRWFSRYYPDGTLVQASGEPGVWLIEDGYKRPILSAAVLNTRFNKNDIITTSKVDLASYPTGRALKYPNYSIVQDSLGDIYLLVDDAKKKFESLEVFRKLGFNTAEIELADDADLITYAEGRDITLASAYPYGQLIQDQTTGGVYFVQDGFKHPIVSREILKVNFANRTIVKGDQETLNGFVTAHKVLFYDGKLVKSVDSPDVYVISNGQRRRIANEETFRRLGYEWTDIIETNAQAIQLHSLGDEINAVLNDTSLATY
jgi:hypothetical protein